MTNELEKIIEMALKDGSLTDTERQVINLRASKLGLNTEEVDMLINARIARMQIEGKLPKATAAPKPVASKSIEAGPAPKPAPEKKTVKKCLHCGAVLSPLAVKCPECGEYVEREKAKSAVDEFREGVAKAGMLSRKTFIRTFPVPKNAEDLLDFTLMIHGCASNSDDLNVDAYRAKLKECHNRIKLLYPDDERFTRVLEMTKPTGFAALSQGVRALIIGVSALIFLVLIFVALSALVDDEDDSKRDRDYDIEQEVAATAEESSSSIDATETAADEVSAAEEAAGEAAEAIDEVNTQAEDADKQMEEIQRKAEEQMKKAEKRAQELQEKAEKRSKELQEKAEKRARELQERYSK